MITTEKAKIILEDGGTEKFSDEEILIIKEYLEKMAEIVINSNQLQKDDKKEK